MRHKNYPIKHRWWHHEYNDRTKTYTGQKVYTGFSCCGIRAKLKFNPGHADSPTSCKKCLKCKQCSIKTRRNLT